MEFRPLRGVFGAEAVGVPPDPQVANDAFCRVEAAWLQSSILSVRGLRMTSKQSIALTQRLADSEDKRIPNGGSYLYHIEMLSEWGG